MGFYLQIALQFAITVFSVYAFYRNRTKPWIAAFLAALLMTGRRITALMSHVDGESSSISLLDQLILPGSISVLQLFAYFWFFNVERSYLALIEQEKKSFERDSKARARVAKDGRILLCNEAFAKFMRRPKSEIYHPSFTWMGITPDPWLAIDLGLLTRLENREIDSYSLEKPYDVAPGLRHWGTLTVSRAEESPELGSETMYYPIEIVGIGLQPSSGNSLDAFDEFVRKAHDAKAD